MEYCQLSHLGHQVPRALSYYCHVCSEELNVPLRKAFKRRSYALNLASRYPHQLHLEMSPSPTIKSAATDSNNRLPENGHSERRSSSSTRASSSGVSCTKHPACYAFNTTASHGSKDALEILESLATPASLLFDPRYTSRRRPSPAPPFRTFPPSPREQRLAPALPSTISIQNLDNEQPPVEDMDKRHPSSFQQLEKLGEGTYATVSWEEGNPDMAFTSVLWKYPAILHSSLASPSAMISDFLY